MLPFSRAWFLLAFVGVAQLGESQLTNTLGPNPTIASRSTILPDTTAQSTTTLLPARSLSSSYCHWFYRQLVYDRESRSSQERSCAFCPSATRSLWDSKVPTIMDIARPSCRICPVCISNPETARGIR